jgi:hypothetical protein
MRLKGQDRLVNKRWRESEVEESLLWRCYRSAEHAAIALPFNILALLELRACCDELLKDSKSPALSTYSGLGQIVIEGMPLNGRFLSRRILSFLPER